MENAVSVKIGAMPLLGLLHKELEEQMRKFMAAFTILVALSSSAWAAKTTTDKDGCVLNAENEGGEQTKVCETGVTVGGPIRDVSVKTPLGGKNAAIPKAGRDIEKAVHKAGRALGIK